MKGVFLLWDIAHLFQKGQIDIGFHIALSAWITIPVPGAAEIACLVNDSNIVNAGLFQAHASQHAAESATNNSNLYLVGQRFSIKIGFYVRVVDIVGKVAGRLLILRQALLADPLVPLFLVSGSQHCRVEPQFRWIPWLIAGLSHR